VEKKEPRVKILKRNEGLLKRKKRTKKKIKKSRYTGQVGLKRSFWEEVFAITRIPNAPMFGGP